MMLFVVLFIAGVFALAWWVSVPVVWWQRWLLRLAVLAMLAGLALPPAAIEWLRDLLSALLPLAREASQAQGASVVMHFGLFAVVSALLFVARVDLHRFSLPVMAVLAFVLEALQLLIDGRVFEVLDIVVNLLGVAAGWLAWWLVFRRGSATVTPWR
ncbi:MAG: VanZ family protein [Wenzhouxiangella sp.]